MGVLGGEGGGLWLLILDQTEANRAKGKKRFIFPRISGTE